MDQKKKKNTLLIGDVRCHCGNLLFLLSGSDLQIKCKRCKNITTISLKKILHV